MTGLRPRLALPHLPALLLGAVALALMVTHTGPLLRPEILGWKAAAPAPNAAAASSPHHPVEAPLPRAR